MFLGEIKEKGDLPGVRREEEEEEQEGGRRGEWGEGRVKELTQRRAIFFLCV